MTGRKDSVRARGAAKINLHLGVGGRRDDGFHELHTVYQAISLHDEVAVSVAEGWDVTVATAEHVDAGSLPAPEDNIVPRAAELLAERHGRPVAGRVEVTKAIPVAGGLAGGSADAAATLVALDRLWGLETPPAELLALAAELGSDVPFAVLGGTALGTGHGERVMPVPDPGTWHWVLVTSREGLSTPAVYRRFDELYPDAPAEPAYAEDLQAALTTGDPRALARELHNDLQEPAFDLRPDLRALVARGEAEGALRGLVSGSGPTCLFLCADDAHAGEVAAGLRGAGHEAVLAATGPVPGATVVD